MGTVPKKVKKSTAVAMEILYLYLIKQKVSAEKITGAEKLHYKYQL